MKLNLINNKVMIEFLNKQKVEFDQNDLVYIKDLKSFIDFSKNGKLTVPDHYVYNKDQFLINQDLDKEKCGALFQAIEDTSLYNIDNSNTLHSFLNKIDFINQNQKYKEKEFVIFITWGTFAHKNSNKESFEAYTELKKKYSNKVKIYLLNLDINESWNLTPVQKKILKI